MAFESKSKKLNHIAEILNASKNLEDREQAYTDVFMIAGILLSSVGGMVAADLIRADQLDQILETAAVVSIIEVVRQNV
ncbi:MAG: hypothetical protein K2X27_18305 [Candidatus Obscuribacterales bacterium]|nr:hypothetical protein [Candidatus Obscuribacterales bacterium]